MRELPVRLSSQALADLAEIRRWLLVEAGPHVSSRVVARVRRKIAAIGKMPYGGSFRPEFGPGVRFHIAGAYVIYVDVGEIRIDVLRILHAARDRDAIMRGVQEDVAPFAAAV